MAAVAVTWEGEAEASTVVAVAGFMAAGVVAPTVASVVVADFTPAAGDSAADRQLLPQRVTEHLVRQRPHRSGQVVALHRAQAMVASQDPAGTLMLGVASELEIRPTGRRQARPRVRTGNGILSDPLRAGVELRLDRPAARNPQTIAGT